METTSSMHEKYVVFSPCTFTWEIGEVKMCEDTLLKYKVLGTYYSRTFKITEQGREMSWIFRLKDNGFGFISVHLALASTTEATPLLVLYNFTLLTGEKEISSRAFGDKFCVETKETGFLKPKGFDEFIRASELPSLISKSRCSTSFDILKINLALRCEINANNLLALRNDLTADNFLAAGGGDVPKSTLLIDLKNLLIDNKFSDVTFTVKGKEFHAHKAVLTHRSSVFRIMFDRATTNANEKIAINDTDPGVFKLLLKYIYTDDSEINQIVAPGLLQAAEKYNLIRLKAMCDNFLVANLKTENAVDMLLLADSQNAMKLKNAVMKYINEHSSQISGTEKWNRMSRKRPDLITECFVFASTKSKQ